MTPRIDYLLTRNKSFRRMIRLLNPDKTPVDLAGATITLHIEPWSGAAFEVTPGGPSDQKLFVEPATQLTATLGVSASEMAVADAGLFNAQGFVKIEDETIAYNSRPQTTKVAKLGRGAAGTIAAAHDSGHAVRALGQILIYLADEVVNGFTWRGANFRLQLEDSQGDGRPLYRGEFRFEKLRV